MEKLSRSIFSPFHVSICPFVFRFLDRSPQKTLQFQPLLFSRSFFFAWIAISRSNIMASDASFRIPLRESAFRFLKGVRLSSFQLAPGPLYPGPRDPYVRSLRRRLFLVVVPTLILIVVFVAREQILIAFAKSFRVDDPAPSDAIVLLMGGLDHRPKYAAKLIHQGLAPVILLGRTEHNVYLQNTETEITLKLLDQFGVPRNQIVVFDAGEVNSTRDEALLTRDYALKHHYRRVTLVTTAFHTARARWIFHQVFRGSNVEIRTAAVAHPRYDETDWFRSEKGLIDYFEETIKTIIYHLKY